MTGSLVLLCAGAFAAVSFSSSALIGVLLAAGRGWRGRLSAHAESRLALAAALAPGLVALAALAAALLPSLGWLPDHCLAHGAHHPHLCVNHGATTLPAAPLLGLAGLLAARGCIAALRAARILVSSWRAARSLDAASRRDGPGLRRLPVDAPEAFVIGMLRPRVYVSDGLLRMPGDVVAAVLAHERAHVARRDPLRRLAATVALCCHLPGLASRLERSLHRCQEMAADADAARALGDGGRVASALVTMARARRHQPSVIASAGLAYAGSHIRERVHRLLRGSPGCERPGPGLLAALAMALPAGMLACAAPVHHAVETVLGLLS